MKLLHNLLKPVNTIKKGASSVFNNVVVKPIDNVSGGIGDMFSGVGSGVSSIGKGIGSGVSSISSGISDLVSSPLLIIGGVVILMVLLNKN